jgi:hypothetical protein
MTKTVMRFPTPSPPLQGPGGLAPSDSKKAEVLANSLETQFQPVDNPSRPPVIEMVNEAMRTYDYALVSKPDLTRQPEVLHAIKALKFGEAPGPNGAKNRLLKHLTTRARTFLTKVFNVVLRRQYFPPDGNALAWCPY